MKPINACELSNVLHFNLTFDNGYIPDFENMSVSVTVRPECVDISYCGEIKCWCIFTTFYIGDKIKRWYKFDEKTSNTIQRMYVAYLTEKILLGDNNVN